MQVKVLRTLQDNVARTRGGNQQQTCWSTSGLASKSDLPNHPLIFKTFSIVSERCPTAFNFPSEREDDALILFEHFTKKRTVKPERCAGRSLCLVVVWMARQCAWTAQCCDSVLRWWKSLTVGDILACRPNSVTESTTAGILLAVQVQSFERKVIHDALVRYQGRINDVMQDLDLPVEHWTKRWCVMRWTETIMSIRKYDDKLEAVWINEQKMAHPNYLSFYKHWSRKCNTVWLGYL